MNINKDGKTLYFSDEELDTETDGEKRVFVTKRINGEETHNKIQKDDKNKKIKENINNKESFNFNDEIIIGVTKKEDEKNKVKKNKDKKSKNLEVDNKKVKRKKNHKKNIAIVGAVILIIASMIFTLTTPIFNTTEIKIDGNKKVSSMSIISLSELKKNENIFKYNKKSVISKIKENQYIESVEIKRILPGTIKISVQEREIAYQIKLINSYAYLNKNGYILENSSIKQDVPVIAGFSISEEQLLKATKLENKDIEKLEKVIKIMNASEKINIKELITEINVQNDDDFILYLESKNKKIYIGDETNLSNKMLYIQKILENEEGKSGTIIVNKDISSGFKPYFREE